MGDQSSPRVTRQRDLGAVPSARLTGSRNHRLPNSASFVLPGTGGEAVLLGLQERGVICSSGSACATGSDEPSHLLTALGIAPEVAQTAMRFTLSADNTHDDVTATIERTAHAVRALSMLGAEAPIDRPNPDSLRSDVAERPPAKFSRGQ